MRSRFLADDRALNHANATFEKLMTPRNAREDRVATGQSLVTIVVRLVGPFDRDAEIVGLTLRELLETNAELS